MIYQGSCHCGNLKYEVVGDIDSGMACNCSMCGRRGSLLWFTARDQFHLKVDDSAAATYLFNKHAIRHRFCATCGIHPWGEALDPQSGRETVAINIRCIEGLDLEKIPVTHYDGRAI